MQQSSWRSIAKDTLAREDEHFTSEARQTLETVEIARAQVRQAMCAHEVAYQEFSRKYYGMMLPSIVCSAFISVISLVVPADKVEMLSGVLSAVNTILMSICALMKYQARMGQHQDAFQLCASLVTVLDDTELQIREKARGLLKTVVGSQEESALKKFIKDHFDIRMLVMKAQLEDMASRVPLTTGQLKKATNKMQSLYAVGDDASLRHFMPARDRAKVMPDTRIPETRREEDLETQRETALLLGKMEAMEKQISMITSPTPAVNEPSSLANAAVSIESYSLPAPPVIQDVAKESALENGQAQSSRLQSFSKASSSSPAPPNTETLPAQDDMKADSLEVLFPARENGQESGQDSGINRQDSGSRLQPMYHARTPAPVILPPMDEDELRRNRAKQSQLK